MRNPVLADFSPRLRGVQNARPAVKLKIRYTDRTSRQELANQGNP